MGRLGRVAGMITEERAQAIATLFGFPADADLFAVLEWAEELLHLEVERSKVQATERAARKALGLPQRKPKTPEKVDEERDTIRALLAEGLTPEQSDALADLQEIESGRWQNVFHAPTRTMVCVQVDYHRQDRRKPDVGFYQAAGMIHAAWVRYIGPASEYDGANNKDNEPSDYMRYLVTCLRAIGHQFRPDGTFDPEKDYHALAERLRDREQQLDQEARKDADRQRDVLARAMREINHPTRNT